MYDMNSDKARVSVQLFSVLKQRVGARHVVLSVPMPTTAKAVLDTLAHTYVATAVLRPVMRLAVNQVYVDEGDAVALGDELAIITPVSGG